MSSDKPPWLNVKLSINSKFKKIKEKLRELNLTTVCEEGSCPNMAECWSKGTATFMILGDTCTRACKFCHVKTGYPKKNPDHQEIEKIFEAVKEWNLHYVVITSVDRDDLADGGAEHFSHCIKKLKELNVLIEVLIPDFKGDFSCLRKVVNARPDVIGHNIETVERLQKELRDPRASYSQSLKVLENVKKINPKIYTKSSIMLGLGETKAEVVEGMKDLRERKVDFLTLGQYLRPSQEHFPVQQYIQPKEFLAYKKLAKDLGFKSVASGPLVRSSYCAGEFFAKNILKNKHT